MTKVSQNVPDCSKCGQSSPYGDPCVACVDAEVERILAMSDEEIIASSTPEELGWARGHKEGFSLGLRAAAIIETGRIQSTYHQAHASGHSAGLVHKNQGKAAAEDWAEFCRLNGEEGR